MTRGPSGCRRRSSFAFLSVFTVSEQLMRQESFDTPVRKTEHRRWLTSTADFGWLNPWLSNPRTFGILLGFRYARTTPPIRRGLFWLWRDLQISLWSKACAAVQKLWQGPIFFQSPIAQWPSSCRPLHDFRFHTSQSATARRRCSLRNQCEAGAGFMSLVIVLLRHLNVFFAALSMH